MTHMLVIDDESAICWAIREAMHDEGIEVHTASSAEEGLEFLEQHSPPDLILLDVRLPGRDGLSVMPDIQRRCGNSPLIVMTAFGDLDTAVRALGQGAFDYLVKPFDLDEAIAVFHRALNSRQRNSTEVDASAARSPSPGGGLVGRSPPMQLVFKQIALAAPSNVSVLLTGESGTGKELVARAIHQNSTRRDGPFVPVCLPALNPSLIESELFGHVRGAFTGAQDARQGLISQASGGTLFLDEIGDISPAIQVKLLRTLEQREVYPVGSATPLHVDLRVVSATNQPLDAAIARGDFREDLFYRLSAFRIPLPPLRERTGDIARIADHFLAEFASNGQPAPRLSPEAQASLESRSWPGNVRELRNAIERASLLARGGVIDVDQLPPERADVVPLDRSIESQLKGVVNEWWANQIRTERPSDAPGLYDVMLQQIEPMLLAAALRHTQGNRAAAAQLLGLHRSTLRQKLRDYGMGVDSDEIATSEK